MTNKTSTARTSKASKEKQESSGATPAPEDRGTQPLPVGVVLMFVVPLVLLLAWAMLTK